MRILFISNLYPPHDLGGMEQLCREVVEDMRRRGHVCHVLTSRYGVQGQPVPEEGLTRALYLQADLHHYRPLDFFLRRPSQDRANHRALRQTLDAFEPEMVFIWGMWNLSPRVAYWAEQWMPGRVAYNIASYWPIEVDPHHSYWNNPGRRLGARIVLWPFAWIARRVLAAERYLSQLQFKHVSCCSQYMVDALTEAKAIPKGAVAILNGIDPGPFMANARSMPPEGAPLRLLYFGGLMESKGVHTAIEAMGLLQQHGLGQRLHLAIVGGGHPTYEARLVNLTRSLALEDKVTFCGRVPRSQIPGILAHHDVFLFTSVWPEPFGRTIVEAMAAGLAVVGADVGGSKEIFAHYPGDTLFAPGDAQALAHQIHRFLDDPELVSRLGEAGRDLVLERFTLERMVSNIEGWLEEIVRCQPAGAGQARQPHFIPPGENASLVCG